MLSTPRSLGFVLAVILGAMLVPGCRPEDGLSGPSETPATPSPQFSSSQAVPDQYIVVFKSSLPNPAAEARALVAQHGGTLRFTYTAALKGFAAKLPAQALDALRRNPNVAYIEPDQTVQVNGTEIGAPWGLDRSDQRGLPLDGNYAADRTGAGVTMYIIDTGLRYDHVDFGGRAVFGYDALGGDGSDCFGHGTHVAGISGGQQYGVAKAVRLVSVRVLDCNGSGSTSGIIAGLNWVAAQAARAAVANLSLGGSASDALDTAIKSVIAGGVTVAVAAGNSNADACNYSPARVPEALTVGASDTLDVRASFSNWGSCLDLFAPGVAVTSAYYTSPSDTKTWSGTSMATPHVAGVAALYLEGHPSAPPAEVSDSILAYTTKAVVQNAWSAAHNLIYTQPVVQWDTSSPPPAPAPPSDLSVVPSPLRTLAADLSWTSPSMPVATTEVQRRTNDGVWQTAGWAFNGYSQYRDPYVSSGQNYTYRVRNTTPYGRTDWSNEVMITFSGGKKPGGGRGNNK